ncbi:MAG: hypothetical protein HY908_24890 [Myxococcales bacterium]|nr:hypothetical protein [Myxococcales bacterium]
MSTYARVLCSGLLGVLVGCAPAAGPQPPPSPSASASAAVVATAGPGEADAAAVPGAAVAAPGEVVLHARWARPNDTLAALASYTRLPDAFIAEALREGVREMVKDALRKVVDVPAFAEALSLDAPIDAVVIADLDSPKPKARAAVSFGLASFERARSAVRGELTEVAPGVWRMGSEDTRGARCALAESGGTTGKLVCAESYKEVTKLAPYMARGLPSTASQPTDLHVELHLKGVIQRFGGTFEQMARGLPVLFEDLRIRQPLFDNALMEAAVALGDEAASLLYDLEGLEADIGVDATRGLTAAVKLGLANKKSWLAQTLLDGADKQGPAPDVFAKLPRSSEGAFYGFTGNPGRWTPLFKVAQDLVKGALQEGRIGDDADRQAVAALLRPVFGGSVAYASASGHFAPPAAADLPTQIADAFVGWELLGLDESSTALGAYLGEAVKVYNRPGLQAALKKEAGSDADQLPIVKTATPPAALGKGALAFEVTLPKVEGMPDPASGTAKTTSIKAHLLLLPDGNRTWLGVSLQRDALAKLMVDAKNGTDSLGPSALGPFQGGRHAGGAFMTLKGIVGPWQSAAGLAASMFGRRGAQEIMAALSGLPNGGLSPLTVLFDQSDAAPMSIALTVNAPRGLLEDLGSIVGKLAQRARQP